MNLQEETFDDADHSIVLLLVAVAGQHRFLTHSEVNFGMDGLTAQDVRIVLHVPFMTGILSKTRPSEA